VERAKQVVGPDVGDGHDVEIVGIVAADEHAPLVARAEHADPQWVAHAPAVAEVDGAEAGAGGEAGGHGAAEEVAAGDGHRIGEVLLADLLLLFRKVHRFTSVGAAQHPAHQRESGHHCLRK